MAPASSAQYRLSLLGPWELVGPDGGQVRSVLAQPKRLCLLAHLALAGEPVSRSTLVAVFWPDRDEERARNALSQALHYLRRSLSARAIESVEGDRVRVPPERVWFDARVLLAGGREDRGGGGAGIEPAGRADVLAAAKRICAGAEFFEGWNADDSQPLQDWLDEVRRRVRERAEEVAGWGPEALGGEDGRAEAPAAGGLEERPAGGGSPAAGRRAQRPDADAPGSRPARWSRTAWVGTGAVLGILLAIGVLRSGNGATEPGPVVAEAPAEIAVLLPRVTTMETEPPFPADAFAAAVHDEVVARLDTRAAAGIVSVPFESEVSRLVRSLEAQGAIDPAQGGLDRPAWVVSIGVRAGGGRARVIGRLLRGPGYTAVGAVVPLDYPLPSGADVLLDLPRRIAAELVEGLSGVLGGS